MVDSYNIQDKPIITPKYATTSYVWNAVNLALSTCFFNAMMPCQVVNLGWRVDVAGLNIGSVSAVLRKVASGQAISSGVILHSGVIDLKSGASGSGILMLSATPSDLILAVGDSLGFHLTGLPTAAQGCVTALLQAT